MPGVYQHTDRPGTEIADPWYTGNFDATYDDVLEGCTGLLEHLKNTEAFLNLHIFLDLEFTPDAIVCHVEGRCFVYDN